MDTVYLASKISGKDYFKEILEKVQEINNPRDCDTCDDCDGLPEEGNIKNMDKKDFFVALDEIVKSLTGEKKNGGK